MTQTTYLWNPPSVPSLAVRGRAERYPIHRLFFVGRNYHAHAVEMGRPVDKSVERPFYFAKAPSTLVSFGPRPFIGSAPGWASVGHRPTRTGRNGRRV